MLFEFRGWLTLYTAKQRKILHSNDLFAVSLCPPRVASSRGNLRRGPFSRKHFSSAFVILVGGSQSETVRECSGKKAFSIHTNREPLNGSSFVFPGKNEPTGTDLIYGVERALLCPLVVKRADRPLDL